MVTLLFCSVEKFPLDIYSEIGYTISVLFMYQCTKI